LRLNHPLMEAHVTVGSVPMGSVPQVALTTPATMVFSGMPPGNVEAEVEEVEEVELELVGPPLEDCTDVDTEVETEVETDVVVVVTV
jgi:hypothetical protein